MTSHRSSCCRSAAPHPMKGLYLLLVAVALVLAALTAPALSQDAASIGTLQEALDDKKSTIATIEQEAFAEGVADASLAAHRSSLERLSRDVLAIAVDVSAILKNVNQLLTDLGSAPTDAEVAEPENIAAERRRLTAARCCRSRTLPTGRAGAREMEA